MDKSDIKSAILKEFSNSPAEDLIISKNAARPSVIKKSFQDFFKEIRKKAQRVKDKDELKRIAAPFITSKTQFGATVYNNERYPARIKANTRHTTFLRDVEISLTDLGNMKAALNKLSNDTPIYKMYVKAATGSEEVWIEMYFTPEGVKLAQSADIMMEASFTEPDEKIRGHFFAMPEYQEVLNTKNPMELVFIPSSEEAFIFVGGTTYPGDVYKPICKYLNARVYAHGGVEIHAAGILISWDDTNSNERRTKILIISGLSRHGKTTLSMSDISDKQKQKFAQKLGTDVKKLNLEMKLLHDDYLYLKPIKNGKFEIGVYAPNGIFPATHGEDWDNPITSREDVLIFNTVIEDRKPNFNKSYPFENKLTGEAAETKNQRAAAPIRGCFEVEVYDKGQVTNFDSLDYVTLTRDPAAPSAIKWKSFADALVYAAGLVVAPTDAVVERADDFYLNYMCTDFDVAPRGPFVGKMNSLFKQMRNSGIEVNCYTINTGEPEKSESLEVRDSIIFGSAQWKFAEDLGFDYIVGAVNRSNLYLPWDEQDSESFVDRWENMRNRRRTFFEEKKLDLAKAELENVKALI